MSLGLEAADMQALVDMCDPEGARQRQWEQDRADGKRVTGFSSNAMGQEPAPSCAAPDGANPGALGPARQAENRTVFSKQAKKVAAPQGNDIWDVDELPGEYDITGDDRARPEYEVLFKQRVGTNDVYLGLDFERDPSSNCCEEMVVRVHMPKECRADDIQLDVQEERIDLRSDHYRLLLPLQRKVYTNRGSAKWEKDTKRMVITLVLNREGFDTKLLAR
eukprot:TRINITY_DN29858_c0_g1_i1.p1 TRINITY_DN29858_c0_g1~~TRINITY_DN29858_c0_g1_i1.p1  ORF type:complete len:220 (+),score=95.82 TRINITY_DN29858_c0_g1_i1:104-763(+)